MTNTRFYYKKNNHQFYSFVGKVSDQTKLPLDGVLTFKNHPLFETFLGKFDNNGNPLFGTITYNNNSQRNKFEGGCIHQHVIQNQGICFINQVFLFHFMENLTKRNPIQGKAFYNNDKVKHHKSFKGTVKNRTLDHGTLLYNEYHPRFYKMFEGKFEKGSPYNGKLYFCANHPQYFVFEGIDNKPMFHENGDMKRRKSLFKVIGEENEMFDENNYYSWTGTFDNNLPDQPGIFSFL